MGGKERNYVALGVLCLGFFLIACKYFPEHLKNLIMFYGGFLYPKHVGLQSLLSYPYYV